jgi:hypothetical protein
MQVDRKQVDRKLVGLLLIALMAGPALSNAATVAFTYSDPTEGNLVANFTLDVVNGYAVSGTGTATSTLFSGPENLTLLTATSTLPAGAGSINFTNNPPPSGFTWHTVPGSTGPDFQGDAVVNASAAYLDNYGLVFELVNPNTKAIIGGFNPYSVSNSPSTNYIGNLSVGGNCYECSASNGVGTLTVSPVPLPAALPLLLSGIGGLGALARRRKLAKA